jgi:hypothetical protein
MANMSAREKIQAKRKSKDLRHVTTPSPVSSSSTKRSKTSDNCHTNNSSTVDPTAPTTTVVNGNESEWPLKELCDQLWWDLFESQWQIRHGAAIGIRAVLRSYATRTSILPKLFISAICSPITQLDVFVRSTQSGT